MNILAKFIREGQQVRLWAYPADRFPEAATMASGTVSKVVRGVQLTDPRTLDPDDCDVYDGIELTFDDDDTTKWVAVGHTRAIFEGGPPPSDEERIETMAADEAVREQTEAVDAEGVLGLIGVHSGPDEADQPVLVVHLPVIDVALDAVDTDAVEPEQAEAFALRLLRVAAEVRVLREVMAEQDEHHEHDGGPQP